MNKKWPNNLKIGCKHLFNIVELIEADAKLEVELEEFEGAFKKDEILKIWVYYKKTLCNYF
jgi:hypothetical protein